MIREADKVAEQRSGDLNELHNALDGSFNNAPSQLDGEPYVPFFPILLFLTRLDGDKIFGDRS